MGPGRYGKRCTLYAAGHESALERGAQESFDLRHLPDAGPTTERAPATFCEMDIWQLARRMRDEWREHRHSRLMA